MCISVLFILYSDSFGLGSLYFSLNLVVISKIKEAEFAIPQYSLYLEKQMRREEPSFKKAAFVNNCKINFEKYQYIIQFTCIQSGSLSILHAIISTFIIFIIAFK